MLTRRDSQVLNTNTLFLKYLAYEEALESVRIVDAKYSALNCPVEAAIILSPPKVPFIAVTSFVASVCRLSTRTVDESVGANISTAGTTSKRTTETLGTASIVHEVKDHYVAAGMSDGTLCIWKSSLLHS